MHVVEDRGDSLGEKGGVGDLRQFFGADFSGGGGTQLFRPASAARYQACIVVIRSRARRRRSQTRSRIFVAADCPAFP